MYVLDDETPGAWVRGAASRWWLHHSLASLNAQLGQLGGSLHLLSGCAVECLTELAATVGASHIVCSRQVDPWAAREERELKLSCEALGVEFRRYPGSLLFGSLLGDKRFGA